MTLDNFILYNEMAAKYQEDVGQITDGVAELSLPLTVLSWNINGPGKADARRKMIGSVVEHIDPDIMLLQETKKSITRLFDKFPKYKCEKAENEEEAHVLYNKRTFEKVSPSKVNLNKILKEMFPSNTLRSGEVPERREVRKRMCVVHLRHKRTEREIIFVSYHNIRKGGGRGAVKKKASEVCQIIAKLHESSKCCIIAGVDFNCNGFDCANVIVPDYDATSRRQGKTKVDFFILNKSDDRSGSDDDDDNDDVDNDSDNSGGGDDKSIMTHTVEAFDLFPQEEEVPFYEELKRLLSHHDREVYDKALDHDPLKLSL